MHPTPALPPQPAEGATARYAVYWLPEDDDPLWQAGCAWLGRDARAPSGADRRPKPRTHTAAPARYGFHATLKAPIRLASGCELEALLASVERLSQRQRAFAMPTLQVAWHGRFLALRPVTPLAEGHPLAALAHACVVELDSFRRPPKAAELARRRSAGLSAEDEARLLRWGYPQVLEAWKFHLTLSEAWDDTKIEGAQAMASEAQAHFAPALALERQCSSIWVCEETQPGANFSARWRFSLKE